MDDDNILISEKDYLRLKAMLSQLPNSLTEDLEIELDRAKVVTDDEVPSDLVTMNSTLRFLDITEQEERTVTIVYHDQQSEVENKVSVLSSIGSALLGLRQDQAINWRFPDGKTHRLKVLEIIYQPEASKHWHL